MIRVEKQPEPRPPDFDFDLEVRQRGRSALAELQGQAPTLRRRGRRIRKQADQIEGLKPQVLRKYDYWTRALPALHEAYRGICAYACFYIEPLSGPTTDHFVAITRSDPHDAYEWDNYRLACSLMNTCKSDFPDVLDPFNIQDDWFALNLGTFEVVPATSLSHELQQQVQQTTDRLKLNSHDCKSMRRRFFEAYWFPKDPSKPVPLWFLEEQAPFLTREMRRQGRVRPEDGGASIA
jgi:hypothetical protein